MAKEELIEVEGIVKEVLPATMYRIGEARKWT